MAGILELSDWELKTTMVHMPRALMDKVDSVQEQIDNVSREMEILRENSKEILEMKKNMKMKNAFDGLINRWDPAERSISDLGDISIEISHTEKQIEKKTGKTEL